MPRPAQPVRVEELLAEVAAAQPAAAMVADDMAAALRAVAGIPAPARRNWAADRAVMAEMWVVPPAPPSAKPSKKAKAPAPEMVWQQVHDYTQATLDGDCVCYSDRPYPDSEIGSASGLNSDEKGKRIQDVIKRYIQAGVNPTYWRKVPLTAAPKDGKPVTAATRRSVFGNVYPHSADADWKEYPGVNGIWVHLPTEGATFAASFSECFISKRYYPKGSLHKTNCGKLVHATPAKAAGWVACEGNGHLTSPDDIVKALGQNDNIVCVSKTWIKQNGGLMTCDHSGRQYAPGSLVTVRGGERYKKVSARAIKEHPEVFGSCVNCAHTYEAVAAFAREDEALKGQVWCNTCYNKHVRSNVILPHNSESYPKAMKVERVNLGHSIGKDGLVYANMRPLPNVDSFRAVRMFGVEAEVEMSLAGVQRDKLDRFGIAAALRTALGSDFAMIKEDGSLLMNGKYNDGKTGGTYAGFEIVSAPASIEAHRERWHRLHLAEGFKHLRAWDTDTCGFHVHISRESMTSLQIARILLFINHPANTPFMQKVAGRKSSEYYKFKVRPAGDVLKEESRSNETRRWAVNLTNPKTVEFRFFRGTINPRHILRNIEFCDAMCDFTYPASRSLLECADFSRFIAFVNDRKRQWPLLAEWMAAPAQKLIPYKQPGPKAELDRMTLKPHDAPEAGDERIAVDMMVIPAGR